MITLMDVSHRVSFFFVREGQDKAVYAGQRRRLPGNGGLICWKSLPACFIIEIELSSAFNGVSAR